MEKTRINQPPNECRHCKIEEFPLGMFYYCMKHDFLFCKPIDCSDYSTIEKKDVGTDLR